MTRGTRLAVAAIAAALLASACVGPLAQPAAEFDRQFIDMMVPHHQSAIEMAKIAQTRATRQELKTLAAQIISAQEAEIAQLKQWRRDWYGSDQTPGMERMPLLPGMQMEGMDMGAGATMDMTKDVEMLREATEFDREFIDMMRKHHQTAIAAGRLAETRAQRAEVRELGKKIVSDQQREIDQLTEWRRAWYGSS